MRSDGEDRCPGLRRVLVEELIGGNYCHTELPGFRKDRFYSAVVCDKVLDLVAVQRKERSFRASKKGILQNRQHEAAQSEGLFPKAALFKIHQNPVAPAHCLAD